MKVGIIQSNFLPWCGYFDFIREADLFIIHDDLHYTKDDWRNHNKIKTPRGADWITVPVHYRQTEQLIEETTIDISMPWANRILNRIRDSYRRAPNFEFYFPELSALLVEPAATVADLNLRLIHWICAHLAIKTPITFCRQYNPKGKKTERLIGILHQVEATIYLSGKAANAYLEPEMFEQAGIHLEYKTYNYPKYEQLYLPFDPKVSVIDLLFMFGKDARAY